MDNEITTVQCPTCKKSVVWNGQSVYRPFCSKRCQLIDLGEWADEEKRIPSNDIVSDNEEWSDDQQH
ncbi:DNA gyrase inhibitor YacG [Brenneria rubrifaciens]|uniref:DNA gyrase inhibitor YacG n=1 Tax=Brenneria rubrifaciens TaxID=55213 RepID=A0A4P8R1N1_9GAMM|nr:DNA gyrase inhibitor YacG [Brenneria rubrifaciens]QCR09554.1 DNA gyrase inhibitor YacG [Brenneria rubrifaciens]